MKYLNDAAKLAAVMKDVPKEAKPHVRLFTWLDLFGATPGNEDQVAIVELACIGSMVAWILEKELPHYIAEYWPKHCHDDYDAGWAADNADFEGTWPTLVEALAAACKSIGERP